MGLSEKPASDLPNVTVPVGLATPRLDYPVISTSGDEISLLDLNVLPVHTSYCHGVASQGGDAIRRKRRRGVREEEERGEREGEGEGSEGGRGERRAIAEKAKTLEEKNTTKLPI